MARIMNRLSLLLLALLCLGCFIFLSGIVTRLEGNNHCGHFFHVQGQFLSEEDHNIVEVSKRLKSRTDSCYNIQMPVQRVRENSTWIEFILGSGNAKQTVLVYSAFYDDRTRGRNLPNIRLLVTASEQTANLQIHCQLWYPHQQRPYISKVTIDTLQNADKNHAHYLFTCAVFSSDPKPSYVSLTLGDRCANATNLKKIEVPIREAPLHQVGLCVLDTHHLDVDEHPYWLVEWVELTRLLGVKHVTFYNTSLLPQKVHGVIEGYVLSGIAERLHITIPHLPALDRAVNEHSLNTNMSLRSIILNDCLLRNLYRYKYIVLSGFSDVIIPQSGHAYENIAEQYFKSKAASALSFDKLYFGVFKSDIKNLEKGLWVEKPMALTPESEGDTTRTLLVDPDTCIYVKGDGCVGLTEAEIVESKVNPAVHVLPTLATVHSFYMACKGDGKAKCVDFEKHVKNSVAGLDGESRTVSSFNERLGDLQVRVKSVHDMLRLDYDW